MKTCSPKIMNVKKTKILSLYKYKIFLNTSQVDLFDAGENSELSQYYDPQNK